MTRSSLMLAFEQDLGAALVGGRRPRGQWGDDGMLADRSGYRTRLRRDLLRQRREPSRARSAGRPLALPRIGHRATVSNASCPLGALAAWNGNHHGSFGMMV